VLGLGQAAWIFLEERNGINVLPPIVSICDLKVHDKISRVFGYIEILEQEAIGTNLKLCYLLIPPIQRKAKVSIEALRKYVVFCRNKVFRSKTSLQFIYSSLRLADGTPCDSKVFSA